MNRFSKILVTAFMSAALLVPSVAQAMQIRQFDKMALQDQNDYIGDLIGGAQKVLIDEGRSDLAAQVQKLFTEKLGNDQISLGLIEFESNLDRARLADAERAARNPNAHRLEVEDAMLVTLKKNNIPLSQQFIRDFRAINDHFHPQHPLKNAASDQHTPPPPQ